jgi:DNA-binding XRE family transcriptional regulator
MPCNFLGLYLRLSRMTMTQTVTTTTRAPLGRVQARLRQNGAAIRSLREKDGWHQPEFARKVGMSQSALSNIEREKRSARPATIHRIARVLRVPVAAITRERDEPAGQWPQPGIGASGGPERQHG